MHDAVTGERLGVPSVAVMTEKFISAAELMGQVLGAGGYPFAVIEHPISSATREELGARARDLAPAIAAALTAEGRRPQA